MSSISEDVKKLLGISSVDTHFDDELIIYINSSITHLSQLGVSTIDNKIVTTVDTTWEELFLDSYIVAGVKTYIYFKVRLMFDPPTSAFVLTSIENQIREYEWRIIAFTDEILIAEVIDDEV